MASSTNTAGSDSLSNSGRPSNNSTPWKEIVAGPADAKLVDEKNDEVVKVEDKANGLYSADDVNSGSKKPVWKKPSNGTLDVEPQPLMGADSWPALNEISKSPQKSSAESYKIDAVPVLQGNAPSTHKQVTSKPNLSSIQNQVQPARQKSFKRHGGNVSANNGSSTKSMPQATLNIPFPLPCTRSTSSSPKNLSLESGQKVGSELKSHSINDTPQHNFSPRRGNGPHQHGNSSYNHRYGSRKDQDHVHRASNSQRSYNGRDIHPQHNPMPHGSAPYIAPPLSPTMRPFGAPVAYPDFPYYYVPVQPESIRGMGIPYPAPTPHHMFMQYLDPELFSKVIHQIDYYFSNENLIKDTYLRSNMDEQGWVPIKLIAGFKKVMRLTDNVALITEAIQISTVVEVKDDKVRRRNDWMKWLMPESLKVPSQATYSEPGSSSEVASSFQKINIEGESSDIPSTAPPSGDPSL